jgi:hypothetical protein
MWGRRSDDSCMRSGAETTDCFGVDKDAAQRLELEVFNFLKVIEE